MRILRRPTPLVVAVFVGLSIGAVIAAARTEPFGVYVVDGRPTGDEPGLVNGHCAIEVDLALGDGAASYLTSDLSYEYVKINADYRT